MSYVLGIDLGTSSLKGLLFDKNGKLISQASRDYPLLHPQQGYSEQNPDEWFRACKEVILEIAKKVPECKKGLKGLAISGQMHGLVLLDEDKNVLRPAILWNDTRTTKQCEQITEDSGDDLIGITKNKALEGFTLPKILWVQENEPDIWDKVRHIMLPKDYLGYCLTGKLFTDKSDAAGTLLFDVANGSWSKEILEKYNIPREYLPEVYDSTDVVGQLTNELIKQFNFESEVIIAAGGADNACAAVGAGILDDETAMVSIGTSGVFLAYETDAHDRYHGQLHLFNHGEKDAYYSMGVTLAAGHSLNWFKQTFAPDTSFEDLLSNIDAIEIGSEGLLFTPYIVGERTPYADSQIRGSFIGIDTRHTMKHFTRSVLEGITFSLKDSQELMEQIAGKKFSRIVSVGGGAKNKDWLQIQADIFNAEIVTLKSEQGPGQGAAMMAAVGVGYYPSLENALHRFIDYSNLVQPIEENVHQYQKVYARYKKIYPYTKEIIRQV